jgi:hypothetical protein
MAGISRQERERKADLERAARAGFPFAVKAMADAEYASYCRWAPGPRMSRQQWDAFMAHDEAFGGPELRAAEKFERDSADDSELSRIESPACDG